MAAGKIEARHESGKSRRVGVGMGGFVCFDRTFALQVAHVNVRGGRWTLLGE